MFKRVLKAELSLLMRERSFWFGLVILTLTTAVALFGGASWLTAEREKAHESLGLYEESLQGLRQEAGEFERTGAARYASFGGADPGYVANRGLGTLAFLPLPSAAALAVGQSDLFPGTVHVSGRSPHMFIDKEDIRNPLLLAFGVFDLAFVIIFILPIVTLAISYNLLTQDREDGTLAFIMAQSTSLPAIAAGKLCIRGLLLFALVVVLLAVAFLSTGQALFTADGFGRFLLWCAFCLAYGFFWLAISFALNSFLKSSNTAALAVASLWLVLVVVVPSLINSIAGATYPPPSRAEMITVLQEARREADIRRAEAMAQYYMDHPDLVTDGSDPSYGFWTRLTAVDSLSYQAAQPIIGQFQQQLSRQQSTVDVLAFLSPAILMQEALNRISGTDRSRHARFRAQVLAFHEQWRAFFLPRVAAGTKLTSGDYDLFPRFSFKEQSLAALAAGLIPLMLGILAVTGVLVWVAFRNLGRYRMA